jgi:hypothetical protein
MAGPNVYESTFRLSQETGLGNYDGGFFPLRPGPPRGASRARHLHRGQGLRDQRPVRQGQPLAVFMERKTRDGARFVGWCAL